MNWPLLWPWPSPTPDSLWWFLNSIALVGLPSPRPAICALCTKDYLPSRTSTTATARGIFSFCSTQKSPPVCIHSVIASTWSSRAAAGKWPKVVDGGATGLLGCRRQVTIRCTSRVYLLASTTFEWGVAWEGEQVQGWREIGWLEFGEFREFRQFLLTWSNLSKK